MSERFDALRLRATLYATIRLFFAERGVQEVETPVLSRAGNTDPNIASFSLEFSGRTDGAPRRPCTRPVAVVRAAASGITSRIVGMGPGLVRTEVRAARALVAGRRSDRPVLIAS